MLFIDLELALSFPHKAISKPWLAVRSHTVFFLLVVRVKGQVPVTQRSLDQDRYPLLVVVFLVKRLLELVAAKAGHIVKYWAATLVVYGLFEC